jgi:RNA polymerase sigma-70 factor (ECF subfamily)
VTTGAPRRLRFFQPRLLKLENATGYSPWQSYPHAGQARALLDDQAVVARVLAGETSAFALIVQRWQGPLVNLAYRFCRDRSRAQDMAQEAFLRAFRGLSKWRGEAAFSTWLYALATNLYRSEIRRVPPAGLDPGEVPEEAHPRSLEEGASSDDRDRVVRRAVLSLPAKYREVVILFYFHEMDISLAARSLGLPEGTVKARLSRGRDLLRQKLVTMLESQEPG